jgi:hypothetical protein
VPMAVAMLPEPMMLMVVMTCAPLFVYGSVGRGGRAGVPGRGVEGSQAPRCQVGPLTIWSTGSG